MKALQFLCYISNIIIILAFCLPEAFLQTDDEIGVEDSPMKFPRLTVTAELTGVFVDKTFGSVVENGEDDGESIESIGDVSLS